MPCASGPITDAVSISPLIVPLRAGQACVPAGPLLMLVHKNTEMAPLTDGWPRWMCACVTSACKPE
jgi:hypothetical protein